MTTAARATSRPDRQVMVVLGNAPTDLTASLRAAGLVRIALDDDIAIWATQSQATVPPGRTAAADPAAPTSTEPPRLLMTVADAALALGLGRSTVYQLIGRGELEVIHVGRSARIPADDVHCLVERLRSRDPAGGLGSTGA